MNRRRYFLASLGLVSLTAATVSWRSLLDNTPALPEQRVDEYQSDTENLTSGTSTEIETEIKDQLYKFSNFDQDLQQDVYLAGSEQPIFNSVLTRMSKIQTHAGYANFSLMGFDEMLKYALSYSMIEAFPVSEIDFMEKIFFYDAHYYGFFGKKVVSSLTDTVAKKDIIKIPHSGNYLFREKSLAVYQSLKKDVGDNLVLTSGIRSIVKQMYLFLDKTRKSNGNFSRASRSLAPPGHSYHALGDFDVGKRNLGVSNFTAEFARTAEYKKLIKLGYVAIRYPEDNSFGVRYEPWHIKVV